MNLISTAELLNKILKELRRMHRGMNRVVKAKALAEQARGRRAEMEAMASNSPQVGTHKLFKDAADHYSKEADYWDEISGA